jgi:alpha-L-fucosidase
MRRRTFLKSSLAAAAICSDRHVRPCQDEMFYEKRPSPTAQQAQWQDMELGMFFHFDIPVYKPGWDWRTWKDLPAPDTYNPKKLDTDQWMEAAKAMGAQYAVFVAKHCSGFLQWQSDVYLYGVRQSSWRNGQGERGIC